MLSRASPASAAIHNTLQRFTVSSLLGNRLLKSSSNLPVPRFFPEFHSRYPCKHFCSEGKCRTQISNRWLYHEWIQKKIRFVFLIENKHPTYTCAHTHTYKSLEMLDTCPTSQGAHRRACTGWKVMARLRTEQTRPVFRSTHLVRLP